MGEASLAWVVWLLGISFRRKRRQAAALQNISWYATIRLGVEGFLDFGIGDGTFADDVPVVAVEPDYCGSQGAAGVACVQDEGQAIA